MDVYCGIDWAEDHHDIALVDRDGKLLARRRISDDAAGLAALLNLLAEHGDTPGNRIPVAIETPRGLLIACLRATGRQVYPINPMAVARYRDRHSVSGGKSDLGDSLVLACVLRTDMTSPAAARRHRARPGHRGTRPRPARRRSGTAPPPITSSAPTCASTTPPSSPPSVPPEAASCARTPGPSWPPRPPPAKAAAAHRRPSCAPCCAKPAAPGASTPKPPGCAKPSTPGRCASFPSSSKPWAARR